MKIALIYMASGFGRRFGENKLLIDFYGKPLFLYGLESLIKARKRLQDGYGDEVELLVVSQYDEILQQANVFELKAVKNEQSMEGITASLRLGTKCASDNTMLYLYFVADQPYMDAHTIERFIRQFIKSKKGIGVVSCDGKRGNPAVFLRKYKQQLLELSGDRGGSQIMRQHEEDVWLFEVPKEKLRDIDTREDLH